MLRDFTAARAGDQLLGIFGEQQPLVHQPARVLFEALCIAGVVAVALGQ